MLDKSSVSVLYRDSAGIWAPLERLYYSTSSKILVSRHPLVSIEEVIACYCPQCFTRYNDEEAMKLNNRCPTCFQCPHCRGILLKKNKDLSGATEVELICTTCSWQTKKPVFDPKSLNLSLHKKTDDLFTELSTVFQRSNSSNFEGGGEDTHKTVWRMEDLEQKLTSKARLDYHVGYFSSATSSQQEAVERYDEALGIPLRTKKTLRCRHDFETGKMNILIQTKQNPLDGDSSMKLQRGKWWIKDSSAILDVPQFSVIGLQCKEAFYFLDLRITNPKDSEATITIGLKENMEESSLECDDLGRYNWTSIGSFATADQVPRDSLSFVLCGYEDELLREETEETGNTIHGLDRTSTGEREHWTHYVDGNKGFVRIPITGVVDNKVNCLLLSLTWTINGSEMTTDAKIKFSVLTS